MTTYDVSTLAEGFTMTPENNAGGIPPVERATLLSGRTGSADAGAERIVIPNTEGGGAITFEGRFVYTDDGRLNTGASTLTGLDIDVEQGTKEIVRGFALTVDQFLALEDQSHWAFIQTVMGGNDTVIGSAHNDILQGFGGTDTVVVPGSASAMNVGRNGDGTVTLTSAAGSDLLAGIERIEAADGTLALDVDGTAGQAYRLYSAALNRTPDADGLGYWVDQMDAGASLQTVAASFLGSEEFLANYGDLTDEAFVEQLYINILGRPAEEGGKNYWVEQLQTNGRDVILMNISESPENKTVTAAETADGIWLV